jgi:poly-gamma-glutamate synthesis protein (capsule biosynthesis protein)
VSSRLTRNARRAARRRRVRRILLGLVAVVVLAGAGAGAYMLTRTDDRTVGVGTGTTTTTAPTTTATTLAAVPTTAPRDPVRGSGQPVSFAFGGDVHFEGVLRTKLLADPATVLAPIAPTLSAADVAMVNLETAITDGGTAAHKQYVFRTPATALDALRSAGVDVATMANNHGLDYGPIGLADSLAARQAKQFPVVGIGADAIEAYAPFQLEVKGQRISIFGATDVIDGEFVEAWAADDNRGGLASIKDQRLARLTGAVQSVRAVSDTVVVYLHWGVEGDTCPTPRQKEVSQALIAAGADIVVGSHSHRVEGGGRSGNGFVDFGLGNFAFYNEQGEAGRSGVLQVTATGRSIDSYAWVPARVQGGVATPLPAGTDADAALAHWNELRSCTGLAA